MKMRYIALHASNACCALVVGLWLGVAMETIALIESNERQQAETARAERAQQLANAKRKLAYDSLEIECLGEIMEHESSGELVGHRRLVGMIAIAIKTSSPTETTLCREQRRFSGLLAKKRDGLLKVSADNARIAREVYQEAWDQQLLPRGWECVRNYMISDERLARMSKRNLEKLGITNGRGITFFRKHLEPVATFGGHTAYQPKGGCANPLPTT